MKMTLFEGDYSERLIENEDITKLLFLTSTDSELAQKAGEEQILINRGLMKSLLLAEELKGSIDVEKSSDTIFISISKKI